MKKSTSAVVLAAFMGSVLVLPVPTFAAPSGETQLAQVQPAPAPKDQPAPKKKMEKKKDKKDKKDKPMPKKKKGEDKKKA
jgi:hypothetical protein